ncbi:MAG: Mut7-C RNAse domain-containing protein [Methylococcaceae bacterium]|nr:Mut7-C RNAse domain-containing protein [Methylococcaceae bacterium]
MSREHSAEFRFYEELNDFLPPPLRKRTLEYRFNGHPGIKDPIEVFGIPHTEVELIIVNLQSVGFDYPLQAGDRVAVYPMFESFDVTPLVRLREAPLRRTAFVLDVNLGKLARRLRLLGFDALYSNRYHDSEIADIAAGEKRIVLTRDRRLLYAKRITHGYWVRSVEPQRQTEEIIRHFDLRRQINPFARCLMCNGLMKPIAKADILDRLEPKTRRYYQEFFTCQNCGKIYWEGSHLETMRKWCEGWLDQPA